MVTPDGPPNTLPPRVTCPVCRAKAFTFREYQTGELHYCVHVAVTGYGVGHCCVMSGQPVTKEEEK